MYYIECSFYNVNFTAKSIQSEMDFQNVPAFGMLEHSEPVQFEPRVNLLSGCLSISRDSQLGHWRSERENWKMLSNVHNVNFTSIAADDHLASEIDGRLFEPDAFGRMNGGRVHWRIYWRVY